MAEKDSGDGPSLELPSLGLRRRRREEQPADPASPPSGDAPDGREPTRARPVAVDEQEPAPTPAPRPKGVATGTKEKKTRRRPSLKPVPAAAVTGVVVGAVLFGLMRAALETCDFVRGTSSCQDGGVVMWLAILVFVVILGRFLLRWFGLDEAGSASFLAVGLTAVAILLFSRNLYSPWMALAMPAVCAAAYALSHWVTTAFVEPTGREHHR